MQNEPKITRRSFLAAAGGTVVSIGLPGLFVTLADTRQDELSTRTRPDGRPRVPPGQRAIEKIMDMGGTPGEATTGNWRLRVYGEVEQPFDLSYAELLGIEQVHITCDIHCVTGWTLLDSRWSGVRLATILARAKPRKSCRFIIFEAAAGYTSNIPIRETMKEDVILAHHFFGERLQPAHGAPVRALVPDRYLYKSAKWLEALKVTAHDEPGYWERQGYHNAADPWKEERIQ